MIDASMGTALMQATGPLLVERKVSHAGRDTSRRNGDVPAHIDHPGIAANAEVRVHTAELIDAFGAGAWTRARSPPGLPYMVQMQAWG